MQIMYEVCNDTGTKGSVIFNNMASRTYKYMLTDRKYVACRPELWRLLPTSFKTWWHLVAADEGLDCPDLGLFVNNTEPCKRFATGEVW